MRLRSSLVSMETLLHQDRLTPAATVPEQGSKGRMWSQVEEDTGDLPWLCDSGETRYNRKGWQGRGKAKIAGAGS